MPLFRAGLNADFDPPHLRQQYHDAGEYEERGNCGSALETFACIQGLPAANAVNFWANPLSMSCHRRVSARVAPMLR